MERFCPGGFCPKGDFVQGDFVQGILSRGFCPGDFVLELSKSSKIIVSECFYKC